MRAKFISRVYPADFIILFYYLLVGLFIIVAGALGKLEHWWFYALHHLVVFLLVGFLLSKVKATGKNLLSFIRLMYPMVLFGVMYRETHDLDQVIFAKPLDWYFAIWDQFIFKFRPCVDFATKFGMRWFSELMHIGYFSYFPIIVSLPLIWWFRGRLDMVKRRIFDLAFVYMISNFLFIILPVQGPRVQIPDAGVIPRIGYIFGPFFEWLFVTGGIAGAAFPSSHCSIATIVAANSIKDIPKASPFIWLAVLMLYLATVYGRFHYAVDVIYGAGLGLICFIITPYIYRWLEGFRSEG